MISLKKRQLAALYFKKIIVTDTLLIVFTVFYSKEFACYITLLLIAIFSEEAFGYLSSVIASHRI